MKRAYTILFVLSFLSINDINSQCTGSQLLISQVVEGSSNNKSIEIYNPSGAPIDLSTYTLERVSNGAGAASGSNVSLTTAGMIPAGGVYVISNSSANAAIQDVTDMTSGSISHNGNDSYILKLSGTIVDSYGDADNSASFGANQSMERDLSSGPCPYDTDPEDAFDPADYNSTPHSDGIAAGLGSVVLPVEFTSVSAIAKEKNVVVEWQTASEINNDKFEVERSFDGKSYETIGIVKGEGNSTRVVDYNFVDERPVYGVNYYRLKQVDYDGNYDYSDVVSARVNTDKIIISPSRTQDVFTVHLNNESAASIKVFNIAGQLVLNKENVTGAQELNIGNLTNGTYFVAVTAHNQTQVEKVVKL